ncbi:MAG: GGDEF domain-containing protein [Burkholderiaceae bacterium]
MAYPQDDMVRPLSWPVRLSALPAWRLYIAVVGCSILLSQIATHFSLYLSGANSRALWVASLIAVVVPAIAASSCTWVLLQMLRELRNSYEHAERLANTDSLTGALNRRRFGQIALASITENMADGRPTSVLLLDVDDFKKINDRHGHAAGDLVLQVVANTIKSCMRSNDAIARWGGEEFVILLAGVGDATALNIAERIRQAIAQQCIIANERRLSITASAGLVTHEPCHQPDLDALINHADAAMYAAKTQGKNRVNVWSSPLAAV